MPKVSKSVQLMSVYANPPEGRTDFKTKKPRAFLGQHYQFSKDGISFLIRTIPSVEEFHSLMRASPSRRLSLPVWNCTMPQRNPINFRSQSARFLLSKKSNAHTFFAFFESKMTSIVFKKAFYFQQIWLPWNKSKVAIRFRSEESKS